LVVGPSVPLLEERARLRPAVDDLLLGRLLRGHGARPDVAARAERRAGEDRLELAVLGLARERARLEPLPVDVLRDRAVEEDDERAALVRRGVLRAAVDVTEAVRERLGLVGAPRHRARR